MSKSNISRRRFLRDLGLSAAAAPFLVGLDSLFAHAQVPGIPKRRFIVMYSPNGMLYGNWRVPVAGPEFDITDGKMLAGANQILSPLAPNASKLLVLDRISCVGARQMYQTAMTAPDKINHPGGHQKGMGNLLTGQVLIGGTSSNENAGLANGISIDQVLAKNFFVGKSKFPSLEIGVQVDENLANRYVDKRLSYDGPSKPRTPVTDPFVLYRQVFGSPTGPTNSMRADLDKSVLSAVLSDFARVQPKLSTSDRQLLQQHGDAVRTIETQLSTVVDCGAVQGPAAPTGVDVNDPASTKKWSMLPANFPTVSTMMTNIMVQALSCGLTNVVTFMWANSETDLQYPWVNVLKSHHGMSHARDADLIKVDQWYASQFNAVIDKMKAIPESGGQGSLLDNSLLMWTSCLSDGASHHSDNMPIVLAGSNGGYFRQGRLIRYNNVFTNDPVEDVKAPKAGIPDVSNSDLLVSVLNSFEASVNKPLSTTFGDPRFCKGPLDKVKV